MRCKCLISEMTSNSCNDCDRMFFPEFKELLNYSIEKFNAMHNLGEESDGQELSMMPMV